MSAPEVFALADEFARRTGNDWTFTPRYLQAFAARLTEQGDAKNAERYRYLRKQRWNESTLFVVKGTHAQLQLGTYCPNNDLLDNEVDAAILASIAVVATGRIYRPEAPLNVGWWATIKQALAVKPAGASVAQLVADGVPAEFIGYVVRRGYLTEVTL